jgi:hypothetical protein
MWPGPVATRFGSKTWIPCGGNNKCAVFDTYVAGAAAQFYLWATKYSNIKLRDAIYKWSGHNSSPEYAAFLTKHIPGITMDTMLSPEFFRSEAGWKFMKAQAQWEAGQPYPMTDDEWKAGQLLAFHMTPHDHEAPKPPHKDPKPAEPTRPESWYDHILKEH